MKLPQLTSLWTSLFKRDTCTDLGGTFVSAATGSATYFQLLCGLDYVQNKIPYDLWADDFETCLNACAGQGITTHPGEARCLAVSYAPDAPTSEVVNCFMKASRDPVALFTPEHRVWTAFVEDGPDSPPVSSEPAKTTTRVVSFTSVKSAGPVTVTVTTADASLTSLGPAGTATGASQEQSPAADGSVPAQGSKAWIAGPVLGAVAGVALVASGAFVLLQRRRMRKDEAYRHSRTPSEAYRDSHGNQSVGYGYVPSKGHS